MVNNWGLPILRVWVKQMNCVEMSSIFCQILGPLVLGWAPNDLILGAQLASGEKKLVCIPDTAAFSLAF